MIRKLVVLLSMFLLSLPLFSGVESYLRLAAEWSYDTNAFSSPLPTGFSLDSDFPNGGEFLKRQNIGFSISSDTYFVDESRVGLSLSFAFRAPYHSVSIIPEGSGYTLVKVCYFNIHSSFHSMTGVPSALNWMGSQMYRASLGCSGRQMSAMKM